MCLIGLVVLGEEKEKEETSPWLELKTRTAREPELTQAVPSNTVHPPKKHGCAGVNSVLELFAELGIHSTARRGARTCRAVCG